MPRARRRGAAAATRKAQNAKKIIILWVELLWGYIESLGVAWRPAPAPAHLAPLSCFFFSFGLMMHINAINLHKSTTHTHTNNQHTGATTTTTPSLAYSPHTRLLLLLLEQHLAPLHTPCFFSHWCVSLSFRRASPPPKQKKKAALFFSSP